MSFSKYPSIEPRKKRSEFRKEQKSKEKQQQPNNNNNAIMALTEH